VVILQQRSSQGDIIIDALNFHRNRIKEEHQHVPDPYAKIKERLLTIKDADKRVAINVKDSYSLQTVVVKLEYVHNWWAMGKAICYHEGEEILVPYTIHYSDIYCKKLNVKVIVEGESPYAT
jgi:hypothetical protein